MLRGKSDSTKQAKPPRQISKGGGKFAVVVLPFILDKMSSVEARNEINAAARNPDVSEILLYVDSPGGTVAGVDDLSTAVFRARQVKPVVCFCEDLAASAAYWIASQATEIVCTASTLIGSIGIFNIIIDESELEKRIGVKTLVARTGPLKGIGVDGVTDEQIDEAQKIVDELGKIFMLAVHRGRGDRLSASNLLKVFDGRILVGESAKQFGLVDRIGRLEDELGEMFERNKPERFSELRGEAALEKFEKLSEEEQGDFESDASYDLADAAVAKRFPILAKRALALREEREAYRRSKQYS